MSTPEAVLEPEVVGTEIMRLPSAAIAPTDMMPVISIEQAIQRYNLFKEFVSKALVKDTDFGIIPGTNKNTLYKPGAEKLCMFFGLSVRMKLVDSEEDWQGYAHNGEPFFSYRYACELWRGGALFATSEGSCNSFESKYRYRKAQRVCPQCGEAAIIKGKEEYGGGWLCYRNKGGCGAKFSEGAPEIEGQQQGQVHNPDIADVVNTLQKMAQKRALIGTTLIAVNASDYFTQDFDDAPQRTESKQASRESQPKQEPVQLQPAENGEAISASTLKTLVQKMGAAALSESDFEKRFGFPVEQVKKSDTHLVLSWIMDPTK